MAILDVARDDFGFIPHREFCLRKEGQGSSVEGWGLFSAIGEG